MTDRYELVADPYEDRGVFFEASAQFGEDLAGLVDVYLVNFIFQISRTPEG